MRRISHRTCLAQALQYTSHLTLIHVEQVHVTGDDSMSYHAGQVVGSVSVSLRATQAKSQPPPYTHVQ